jgi:asparagine synthase (glutamine-hydrolysing)
LRGKSIKNFFNQDYKKSISAGGDRNKSHSQISIPIERYIVHPWRQEAVDRLNSSWWTILFEEYDPGTSGWILETRYPFFDIRLVNFTLRLPTVPWCVQKEVLRQAMKGLLPGPILRRPKSSMPPNIYSNKVQDCVGLSWLGDLHDIPGLSDFIDVESAIDTLNSLSYDHKVTNFDPVRILYPFVLGYWLKNNNSYQNFSPKGDLLK